MIKEFNKPVFKKSIRRKKIMNLEDYERLDENIYIIPLRFTFNFWSMYSYNDLFRKLLIIIFNLDSRYCDSHLYFGKDVLLSNYPSYVIKTSLIITFNEKKRGSSEPNSSFCFNNSFIFSFLKIDDSLSGSNSLHELVLNTYDDDNLFNKDLLFKNKSGTIFDKTYLSIKNLQECKKRFLNGDYLDKRDLFLLVFCANSFKELYIILSKIFDENDTSNFMTFMILMSNSRSIRRMLKKV